MESNAPINDCPTCEGTGRVVEYGEAMNCAECCWLPLLHTSAPAAGLKPGSKA